MASGWQFRFRRWIAHPGILLLLWPGLAWPQTLRYILPSQTDPGLTNFNNAHVVCINTNLPPRNQLFLFLPGTGGAPAGYTNIVATAASLGFHSIGLMYANGVTVNSLCDEESNSACFEQIRLDIIQGGTNAEPDFSVSRVDSIENRLTRIIQYLDGKYPAENWGQYLDAQTNIVWPQIVIAGHSQGAGHAGLIAKLFPVVRSLMFADTDWWFPGNRPADWISAPGVTSNELYFGFVHVQDPLVLYSWEIPTWDDYGMSQFGVPLLVESNAIPFQGSHMLTTDLPTQNNQTGQAYHGATVTDADTPLQPNGKPVYLPVWQWMMTGPPVLPSLQINAQGTNVQLSFGTRSGYAYQLQESTNPVAAIWSNSVPPITGDGTLQTVSRNLQPSGHYYRVSVGY